MRKLVLTAVLASVIAAPAMAQKPMAWATEIGLKSTYTVTSVGDDDVSMIGIPGGNGYAGLGGVSGIYATIPVSDRLAVEPGVGVQDLSILGTSITTGNASVRVMFSAWRGLYVGAGPTLTLLKLSGDQSTVWGGQAAVGYRFRIGGNLMGRAEAFYEMNGESDIVGNEDYSSYGLNLGLGLTPGDVESAPSSANAGLWQLVFGFQGGYQHTSADGLEATSFSIPGVNGTPFIFGGGQPIPGIPPLFVQIPVTRRVALEPSFSYSSFDIDGSGSYSAYNLGLKANYAFNKVLYGAVSGEYSGYGGDLDIDATTGFGAAFGARFPLVGGISGRTELSWRSLTGDDATLLGENFTVTGISFGIMAPLK